MSIKRRSFFRIGGQKDLKLIPEFLKLKCSFMEKVNLMSIKIGVVILLKPSQFFKNLIKKDKSLRWIIILMIVIISYFMRYLAEKANETLENDIYVNLLLIVGGVLTILVVFFLISFIPSFINTLHRINESTYLNNNKDNDNKK